MNHTHRLITFLCGVLLAAGFCGCIKEDLSGCPTAGKLDVELTYTLHNTTDADGNPVDLFAQQVHRVEVFVFDAQGRYVKTVTDDEPNRSAVRSSRAAHAGTYHKQIELPTGEYRLVVWGNRYDRESVASGTERLETGRVSLRQLASTDQVTLLSDSLFHGMTAQAVTVKNGEEQTVPVSLTKDRNDVRLVVRYRAKGQTEVSTYPIPASQTTAYLTDHNGTYDFTNAVASAQTFTYQPGRFGPEYDKAFHGLLPAGAYPTEQDYCYVADFSCLRLMKDHTDARIVVNRKGTEVYSRSLMELITKVEKYRTQEALDREDRYLIELLLEYDPADANTLISISINGWNVVDRDIDLE